MSEIKIYSLEELYGLRKQKLNVNVSLMKKKNKKAAKNKKGQYDSSSPSEFFERYRWIMHDVVLMQKNGETKMKGSELYELFLQGKLLLHECTVKSQDTNIPFVLQLKKCVDIYKKILDIDNEKDQEKLKLKEEEMNKPKAAGPVYNEQNVDENLFDPLAELGGNIE
ncbi:hypothetical protein EIN_428690 [Entamoeba invadens IP1]|uniref:Uncharacterized protein n=1 Tax=Entamoeba invadens IP1 TaxID=370355 RepID=A0A0A1UF86_ENTIV|nr:hypothetical protein EIN_428690 [Entamoeba invadens IP1]ELP95143.1 hypothetical protein EIN_428690 [Entamoeba invadens IP1]|eukprot:XP_004261914.1 hypothetical protein EIN_428690 [Entamoeba invadens IP1]